jgi:hypothetical protein
MSVSMVARIWLTYPLNMTERMNVTLQNYLLYDDFMFLFPGNLHEA